MSSLNFGDVSNLPAESGTFQFPQPLSERYQPKHDSRFCRIRETAQDP
jgi:hypothetical protein